MKNEKILFPSNSQITHTQAQKKSSLLVNRRKMRSPSQFCKAETY